MITAAVANALPNLTAALRTQITNDIRNGVGPSGGGGGDAIPQGIHVWIERFTKLKPLAFRSAATPAEAEDWITHMEKLFSILGCPDNFKTTSCLFKLEGDALAVESSLAYSYGGDAIADTCHQEYRGRQDQVLSEHRVAQERVMIRKRQIISGSIRGLLVGMEMTARVRGEGLSQREAEAEYPSDFARLYLLTTGNVYATTLWPLEIPSGNGKRFPWISSLLGLPTTQKRQNADLGGYKLAEIFRQETVDSKVLRLYRVRQRSRYRPHFWKGLQKAWGTRLKFSTAFHPQTDGQSERTIQTLEDMLRACALEWTGSWDEYLCLVEFAYNNSWHASIKAAPSSLYVWYKNVRSNAICWMKKVERLIEEDKSYADKHRRDLEFQVGDRVFLKVSPFRGVKRFGIKGKLSPRFIGPFEILERIGEVSYRLALPPQLSHVHDVFHVSLLRGYHYHPLHVASYPFDQIQPDMSLSEEPESILDRQERVMRNKVIPFVKILWKNHPEREATWETEESMRASYPHFFV
ncbi:putative nucleotidyltransferase, ribonuclease H [Tanacetum coccineum]|uniref:Nucleotidyltransferase, ribonuclease H n=1 Tax=Tanacetum coccineum TaxID=301880 RepID=A0ABQ5GXF9_9ASTR